MTMDEAFRAYLLASADLSAAVAWSGGHRVAWSALPRGGALPSIALHLIGGGRSYTYRARAGLRGALIQIDCWGGSPDEAAALGRLVVAACDARTAVIRGVFIEREHDDWSAGDGPRPDGARDFFRTSLDVRVWFKPA